MNIRLEGRFLARKIRKMATNCAEDSLELGMVLCYNQGSQSKV